jgi:hypothetical protein
MQGLEEKSFAPAGDRTPIVQPVVRHYTPGATAEYLNITYMGFDFKGLINVVCIYGIWVILN